MYAIEPPKPTVLIQLKFGTNLTDTPRSNQSLLSFNYCSPFQDGGCLYDVNTTEP